MLDKKVALTESSETPAQLTDSQIAVDHKVPMCSKENVDLVNYLVLSQENTMQTHTKVCENLIISQVVKKITTMSLIAVFLLEHSLICKKIHQI